MADKVKLTKEEEDAAYDAALRIKQDGIAAEKAAADEADAEAARVAAQAKAEAADKADRKANPGNWIGVDVNQSGVYAYAKWLHPRDDQGQVMWDRVIQSGSQNCEHVAEDENGIWLYRRM